MRILLINHYAGSPRHGMEYRPYYLAREWVRAGHAVHIVGASYSHVRTNQPLASGEAITKRSSEHIDGIVYTWYPTPAYSGNGMGRARNIGSCLRQLWMDAWRLASDFRPQVVIASSTYPLDIWVARRLCRFAGAKLVYEVHDLWPLSPIELYGMSSWHPFIRLCLLAESAAYRHADSVVSMLPKVQEHMADHGLDLRKLHIVPNGISPDDWQGEGMPLNGDMAAHMRAERGRENIIVGYAGAHGLPNALDTLLDAAKLLKDHPIRLLLVGDGHEKVRLQRRVVDERLDNVSMFAPVPKAQIPALLQEFDIAYIGLKSEPLFRFGVSPNKLMDYMMAARPVLFAIRAGNDPVAEAGCGLTVPPDSPRAIADGLLKLASLPVAEREVLGARGQAYVQTHHSYPVLAQRFLSIMDGLA
jgi:glycosyltransferase involved in cell wall biosynthesis